MCILYIHSCDSLTCSADGTPPNVFKKLAMGECIVDVFFFPFACVRVHSKVMLLSEVDEFIYNLEN